MWLKSRYLQQKQSHFGSGTRYTLNGQGCGFQYPSAAFPYVNLPDDGKRKKAVVEQTI
jgi:hypothetical protein